jgi:cell division protein FtsI/penicillin-binding protein 2
MPSYRPTVCALLLLTGLAMGAAPAEQAGPTDDPLAGVSIDEMRFDGERYTQTLDDGRVATFTVDPELQRFADRLFDRNQVPVASAVILNSRTGRVLALSQRRKVAAMAGDAPVALDPTPPAASLFKIVSAAALIEQGNVSPSTETCYHGGASKLLDHHLEDSPRDDTACASLNAALGRSINAIFAKLADRKLSAGTLRSYAERFGFNRELPFDFAVPPSTAEIPADRLERARTAAGFWHTHLSPLHAAAMVQSLAQGGAMLRPYVVDRVSDDQGRVLHEAAPEFVGRSVSKETARKLIDALVYTVERGTARKAFRDKSGKLLLPGIAVAGKTGTLTGRSPYRAYSWFAAVAPADDPEVAISVLVVNKPVWRIKSSGAAAQLLKKYFQLKKKRAR